MKKMGKLHLSAKHLSNLKGGLVVTPRSYDYQPIDFNVAKDCKCGGEGIDYNAAESCRCSGGDVDLNYVTGCNCRR